MDTSLGAVKRGGLAGQDLPNFPPTPSDFEQWRNILRKRPDLKPSIHRLDDGMADRMERCAGAGNGVVPLAAATAFCALVNEVTT